MGRIKGTIIKRSGKDLILYYPNNFSIDFEDNKKKVFEILPEINKKIANSIAGYISRLIKREQEKK